MTTFERSSVGTRAIVPAMSRMRSQASVRRANREPWVWFVALAALVLYVVVAAWLVYGLKYHIGDALARSATADHMVASRDPHLGAMGFYWLPLPMLAQLPFTAVLVPFRQAMFAGPLSTALIGALTIPVMAAIGRVCGVSKRVRVVFLLGYAFNPVIVFTSANGMSEAMMFFFCAVSMLGYLRWARFRLKGDLLLLALGLAGFMATRYEAIWFVPLMAAAAALHEPRRRWARTVGIVVAPAAYVLALWSFASLIIEHDAFWWYKTNKAIGLTPAHLEWLPYPLTPISIVGFCAKWAVLLAPAVLFLIPKLMTVGKAHWQTAVGLAATVVAFPLSQASLLQSRSSWGDPRYFYPTILFSSVLALWLVGIRLDAATSPAGGTQLTRSMAGGAARSGSGPSGMLLACALAASAVVPVFALSDHLSAKVEAEWTFFERLIGRRPSAAQTDHNNAIDPFVEVFDRVDPDLAKGEHIVVDTTAHPQATLFTRHPRQVIIPEDRDFERIMDSPAGRFDWVLLPIGTGRFASLMSTAMSKPQTDGAWQTVEETPYFVLWHFVRS